MLAKLLRLLGIGDESTKAMFNNRKARLQIAVLRATDISRGHHFFQSSRRFLTAGTTNQTWTRKSTMTKLLQRVTNPIYSPLPLLCFAACTIPGSGAPAGQFADAGAEVDAGSELLAIADPPTVGPEVQRPTPQFVASRQVNARFLTFEADAPYWVDDVFGKRGLRSRGVAETETVSELAFGASMLNGASDEFGAYWGTSGHLFYTSWKTGESYDFAEIRDVPLVIADTEYWVYWMDKDACLFRIDKAANKTQKISCAEGTPITLAVTDSVAYWGTQEGGLYRTDLVEGSATERISLGVDGDFSSGIVADVNGVYWSNSESRTILRYNATSHTVDILAKSQPSVLALAQDRYYLYFSTQWDGGIKRVLKV
ncbi:MAG: hypothetical protein JKY56_12625, partial [Kofleriaceae bacterium]|nr:hypothetical protein [Kofleriaceae bacterium]